MKAVGIKLLKAKLSEYLRMVKAGEVILVTEREEVVAELRPCHRQPLAASSLEEHLEQLADKGEATLRSESMQSWVKSKRKMDLGISSQTLLDILRSE